MKTPDKERKAAERKRMRDRGFKLVQFWIHPEDWPKVRAMIERLNKRRS